MRFSVYEPVRTARTIAKDDLANLFTWIRSTGMDIPNRERLAHAIVVLYWEECLATGVSFHIATAQMLHETDHLRSPWSQAPRRNPAGIGVTGIPGEGVSFPTWSNAVRSHVGRLSLYASTQPVNPYDAVVRAEANRARSLSSLRVGSGATLYDMAANWATDTAYAQDVLHLMGVLYDGKAL